MLELITTLHAEFRERLSSLSTFFIPREVSVPADLDKATVAMGMRRVGKTFVLLGEINQLVQQQHIALEQILYIDFEDHRLQPMSQKVLAQLLEDFYALYPENHDRRCYLFLDEIQMITGWPLVVRRFLNTKNVKIYLTGSSAKLLSKEIATSMRGRSLSIAVWPYSFKEYLKAYEEPAYILPFGQQKKDKYLKLLEQYLLEGGFPEVVTQSNIRWRRLLQDYVEVVTYRDIVDRHQITNVALVKYIIFYVIKNAATSVSINKFYNNLKSQGFSVHRDTVTRYLDYMEDAFLMFLVPLYSESVRKTQANPKKCYAIDTGMVCAHQVSFSKNFGRLFENLVYLDLRRRGDTVYYYLTQDRHEVDFFTQSLDGTRHLYQVVWDTRDPATMEREQRALQQAEQELGVKGTIIDPVTYFTWVG